MSLKRSSLESGSVKRMAIWFAAGFGVLLIAGFAALSMMAGSPKDAILMLRYALPHMHRGKLRPGDAAPDAPLLALNGKEQFRIRERIGSRPLMIVFGSYT